MAASSTSILCILLLGGQGLHSEIVVGVNAAVGCDAHRLHGCNEPAGGGRLA